MILGSICRSIRTETYQVKLITSMSNQWTAEPNGSQTMDHLKQNKQFEFNSMDHRNRSRTNITDRQTKNRSQQLDQQKSEYGQTIKQPIESDPTEIDQ